MSNKQSTSKVTEEAKNAALSAAVAIKAALPDLITLTPEERQTYGKVGDRTLPFLQKALDHAEHVPAIVPSYVDLSLFNEKVDSLQNMESIYIIVSEIYHNLSDTMTLCGYEAYTSALSVYNTAKDAAHRNVSGAKEAVDDMSSRFPGKKSKTDDTATTK